MSTGYKVRYLIRQSSGKTVAFWSKEDKLPFVPPIHIWLNELTAHSLRPSDVHYYTSGGYFLVTIFDSRPPFRLGDEDNGWSLTKVENEHILFESLANGSTLPKNEQKEKFQALLHDMKVRNDEG